MATYDAWGTSWGSTSAWGISWVNEVPVAEPEATPVAAPDRGFDETLEAFRLQMLRERIERDEREIEQIAAFDDELVARVLHLIARKGKDPTDAN